MTTSSAVIGSRRWAVADIYIPPWSNGPAPEMVSHDAINVLNTNDVEAQVRLTLFFEEREPVQYGFTVGARRTHHQRLNDLDDPEPVPRGLGCAAVVECDVPVVVQQTRLDSRQAENALLSTIAFPQDPDPPGEKP